MKKNKWKFLHNNVRHLLIHLRNSYKSLLWKVNVKWRLYNKLKQFWFIVLLSFPFFMLKLLHNFLFYFMFSVLISYISTRHLFLCSVYTFTYSAGDLPQVPPWSDSYSRSLSGWHEEGASAGSHRHDGAVRPLRAGGETAQNCKEENPRYDGRLLHHMLTFQPQKQPAADCCS